MNERQDNQLSRIQALQVENLEEAEELTLAFIRQTFPDLGAAEVELRPQAVSLNSFNGIVTVAAGKRFFFKSHVEPDSVISEYYNVRLLAEAGYPILRPLYSSTDYGRQMLIYEVVEWPSMFGAVREVETRGSAGPAGPNLDLIRTVQRRTDANLFQIYQSTLKPQLAVDAAEARVHQLLYHRLSGERYRRFYVGKPFSLPGLTLSWEELLGRRWLINGISYDGSLGAAIDEARSLLAPNLDGCSIVGHGDAHNGNLFLTPDGVLYFDPAFGGRHHPLLDLAKPLFHNVFALPWLYYPEEAATTIDIRLTDDGGTLCIEHDHALPPIRRLFWESKVQEVLSPLVPRLDMVTWLRYLKAAMMCCPLLTMNLQDRQRFNSSVALLGISYVVQCGMTSPAKRASMIDRDLRSV
jgi:hypothetical protein